MTYEEMGESLRANIPQRILRKLPHLATVPAPRLAKVFLAHNPERGYRYLSSNADAIRRVSRRPRRSSKLWEGNRLTNEAQMIANDAAETRMLHDADIYMEASARGVTVSMMENEHAAELVMRVADHQSKIRMKEYWETAHLDLDAADRSVMAAMHQLMKIHTQLTNLYQQRSALIGRRDMASRDERRLLDGHIKILEVHFHAAGETMVSTSNGNRLLEAGDPADSSASGEAAPETPREPISVKGFRMGQ